MRSVDASNKLSFLMNHALDECDHSVIEVRLTPQQEGTDLYLHAFIGETELVGSPAPFVVTKN